MINAVNLPRGSHAAQISIFPRSAIIHRLLRLLHDSGPQALQAELSFRGRRRIFPLLCLLVPVSLLVCCSFTVLLRPPRRWCRGTNNYSHPSRIRHSSAVPSMLSATTLRRLL